MTRVKFIDYHRHLQIDKVLQVSYSLTDLRLAVSPLQLDSIPHRFTTVYYKNQQVTLTDPVVLTVLRKTVSISKLISSSTSMQELCINIVIIIINYSARFIIDFFQFTVSLQIQLEPTYMPLVFYLWHIQKYYGYKDQSMIV